MVELLHSLWALDAVSIVSGFVLIEIFRQDVVSAWKWTSAPVLIRKINVFVQSWVMQERLRVVAMLVARIESWH